MLRAVSSVLAFDFQAKTVIQLHPKDIPDHTAREWFCWLDVDATSASAEGDLRLAGLPSMTAEAVLREDADVPYTLEGGSLRFTLVEARYADGRVEMRPIHVVLTERLLVTAHRGPADCIQRMAAHCRDDFQRFGQSAGFLLYEIADGLLDSYRRGRRRFAETVELLHDRLLEAADEEVFARVSTMTRDLLRFRKTVLDTAETLHELATRKSPFVPSTTQPFLLSVAEAVSRVGEDLTVHRDTLNDAVNLYLSAISHHTNRVVKRLTIVGTIFMPLTFLCGIYGMNMDIPEVKWEGMYLLFWIICIATVAGLVWMMRRWKWL